MNTPHPGPMAINPEVADHPQGCPCFPCWAYGVIRRLEYNAARDKAELTRYKRLEALLRDRADASCEPGDTRYRGNAEMQVLTDWENGE